VSPHDEKIEWVVFRHELHGKPTHEPKVTSRTDVPKLMWIGSQPRRYHPDRGADSSIEKFGAVKEAYEMLIDSGSRHGARFR
jgi:hypothetical protein